jgi:excisionase family DNA binding protein
MPETVDSRRTLLSTTQASEITGLSVRYIQRLLSLKRIEGTRIGVVWLVYEDSLKTFVAQPRRQGRPKGPYKKSTNGHVEASSHTQQAKETD